jgi:hypothetical protein
MSFPRFGEGDPFEPSQNETRRPNAGRLESEIAESLRWDRTGLLVPVAGGPVGGFRVGLGHAVVFGGMRGGLP